MYLQIIAGNEKPPLPILLKNLPILLKVMATGTLTHSRLDEARPGESSISTLKVIMQAAVQMILGLLYKAKKKRALAVQHLTGAKRIFSQFGQTPILARVETALAELGQ